MTFFRLGKALIRSVVKNISLTFLFPVCFTLFSFQNRRTIYDVLAGSIVVDTSIPQPPRQAPIPTPPPPPPAPPQPPANDNNDNNNDNEANNNNNYNNFNQNI